MVIEAHCVHYTVKCYWEFNGSTNKFKPEFMLLISEL